MAVLFSNVFCLILSRIVAETFHIDEQKYLDVMFKIFDIFYVLEVVSKLFVYVLFSDNIWKSLSNKIFLMEVIIGLLHIVDLAFWKSNTYTRILRLFFILRILTMFDSLKKFTSYILQSLPTLVTIVGCFFIIFFSYSIIGVELFGGNNRYRCR